MVHLFIQTRSLKPMIAIGILTRYKMILKPLSILPMKKKKVTRGRMVPQSYGDGGVSTTVLISRAIFFFIDSCLLKPMIQFGL